MPCSFGIVLLLAYAIAANIKHILLGNDQPTFARMFLQREEILNHLSEGILAFDENCKAVYKNSAGENFYPNNFIREGHPLYNDYKQTMKDGAQKIGLTVNISGRNYIASVISVVRKGLFKIVMIILRDRTEIVHLNKQIMGTNHIIDALRENTHEFLNKL